MKATTILALTGAVFSSLFSLASAAESKSGFYGGVNLTSTEFSIDEGYYNDQFDQSSHSGGAYFGYKHFFTRGFFVSGEIFYNDTSSEKYYFYGQNIDVGEQYGIKSNIGYEWSWGGAVYGIIGSAHYEYDAYIYDGHYSQDEFGVLDGIGYSHRINDQLSVNAEATFTGDELDYEYDDDVDAYIFVFRLGLSYHF